MTDRMDDVELTLVSRLVEAFERIAQAQEALACSAAESLVVAQESLRVQKQLTKTSGALETQLIHELAEKSAGSLSGSNRKGH